MSTYVLYNDCYGGFGFSQDFLIELFEQFPPHTIEGKKLFKESNCDKLSFDIANPILFFGDYYFLNYRKRNDDEENENDNENDNGNENENENDKKNDIRKPPNIINIKTNQIYYLNPYMTHHRANQDIIKFLFERVNKLSEERFNEEYDKILAKIRFKELVTEDGTKKYGKHNWMESDVLVSYLLTLNISDTFSKLRVEKIKPNLVWKLHEYDGSESIYGQFDYYKMITELIHELQINKVNPSLECSEMLAKVIKGDMTVDDLKNYENS